MSQEPIDMILHCPLCGTQHIDKPESEVCKCEHPRSQHTLAQGCYGLYPQATCNCNGFEIAWDNPPHKSHLCHACGTVWRPADVPTNGVQSIKTRGKCDTWSPKVEEKDLVFAP